MAKRKARYKSILFTVLVMTSLCCGIMPLSVHASENSEIKEIIREQARSREIRQIEDQLELYSGEETNKILEGYDPEEIIENAANGKVSFNFASVFRNALKYMLDEIYKNIDMLLKLVLIVVMCAILKNIQASFLGTSVADLAFYTCYTAVISIALVSFSSAMKLGTDIIDKMIDFMYATVPVLITLIASSGNLTSAGIFQPLIIMMVEFSASIIRNVFIPLVFLSTVLSIVSNISERVQILNLSGLVRQITTWGLGILLTVFVAVVAVQGSISAVADGVANKTVKYAIGNFIPVVGKCLSDAADVVLGCALLIKNGAGIAVMAGIIAMCIVPLLKIVAIIVLYRAACALIEPLSEKRITNCISEIAGSMSYILGIASSVAFMFLISVTTIIGAGNLSAMIR